ncbi:hypothetical protein [Desulfonatronovibrio hydrogenovorans]|uniref:hypothetical protein n=1 Tax=Desulfonatronovibrio hydrogenovorans TaxID=53245 RepID=UPI00048FD938|nr:hypothetical protein [Desulfonatronovibrio hydrogenovorans]
MRGIPEVLKTKADYERARALFLSGDLPERDKQRAKRHWQSLLYRWAWSFDKEIESEEQADSGDQYRVVKEHDEGTGELVRMVQEVRLEDPQSRIFRLGFTVQEVEAAILEMEGE